MKTIIAAVVAGLLLVASTRASDPFGLPASPSLVWNGAAATHITQSRLLSGGPQGAAYLRCGQPTFARPACVSLPHWQRPGWNVYGYQPYFGYYQQPFYVTSNYLLPPGYVVIQPPPPPVKAAASVSDPNRIYSTVPLAVKDTVTAGPIVLRAPSSLPIYSPGPEVPSATRTGATPVVPIADTD